MSVSGTGIVGGSGNSQGFTQITNPQQGNFTSGVVGGSWWPGGANADPIPGNDKVLYAHVAAPSSANQSGTIAGSDTFAKQATGADALSQMKQLEDALRSAAEKMRDAAGLNEQASRPVKKEVTVSAGDSLSKIAEKHGLKWEDLYALNKDVIGSDPNLIKPGQKLKLP